MRIPGRKSEGPERVSIRDLERIRDKLLVFRRGGRRDAAGGRFLASPVKDPVSVDETRAKKVERIRVALADGAYRVEGKTVAAKMVEDVLQRSRGQGP